MDTNTDEEPEISENDPLEDSEPLIEDAGISGE